MKGHFSKPGGPRWVVAAILFFAGCASTGRLTSSDEFESRVAANPDAYVTDLMADSGIVQSVEKAGDGTMIFHLTGRTVDFVVRYRHELADVEKHDSISFLGRVRGRADGTDEEGEPARAIEIQAIEIDTGSARHYLTEESEAARAWSRNSLHLQ